MDADEDAPFVDSNVSLYAIVAGDDSATTALSRWGLQGAC
jgi:hypothetical protein